MAFEISNEIKWILYIVIISVSICIGWYIGSLYENHDTTGLLVGLGVGILAAFGLYYFIGTEGYSEMKMTY